MFIEWINCCCCCCYCCSVTQSWLFVNPWAAAHQASRSFTTSRSFLKLMSIESVMSSNRLTLCHPLLLLPPIFSASGSFPMSRLLASGGQSIGASASASVLPMNIQDWFPLGWTGWISLQSKGLSRVLSNSTIQRHQLFNAQLSLQSNSYIHTWLLEKPEFWWYRPLSAKRCMSLLFNMLSRFVIAFLPRSKHLLTSCCSHHPQWFWSPRK